MLEGAEMQKKPDKKNFQSPNQTLQKTIPQRPSCQYYGNTGRKGQGYIEGGGGNII